jgi:hypothetical protein
MRDVDAEQRKIDGELDDAWWRAQRLVWHSPAWNAVMERVEDLERRSRYLVTAETESA